MTTIIITIPWFYPAYKAGGPIQSITNMVDQFSEDITYRIVCSNTDLGGIKLAVAADKWIDYNANTKVLYLSKNQILPIIEQERNANHTSILFINGLYSWRFNLVPLLLGKADRKIVSVRGMLHPGALSQKRIKKDIPVFVEDFRIS